MGHHTWCVGREAVGSRWLGGFLESLRAPHPHEVAVETLHKRLADRPTRTEERIGTLRSRVAIPDTVTGDRIEPVDETISLIDHTVDDARRDIHDRLVSVVELSALSVTRGGSRQTRRALVTIPDVAWQATRGDSTIPHHPDRAERSEARSDEVGATRFSCVRFPSSWGFGSTGCR